MRSAIVVLALFGCVWAQLTSHYSQEDAAAAQKVAGAGVSASASSAWHASRIVALTGGQPPKGACGTATDLLNGASKLADVAYALGALDGFGCAAVELPSSATAALEKARSAKSMNRLYYASIADAALVGLGVEGGAGLDADVVVAAAGALAAGDGLFKASASKTASALYTGMAYHVIAHFLPATESADAREAALDALSGVASVLATGEGSEDTTLELGEGDKLAATSLVISGMLRLAAAAGEGLDVDAVQVSAYAEYIMSWKGVDKAATQSYVLQALHALSSTSAVPQPVVVELLNPTVRLGAADVSMRVSVTTLLGTAADVSGVTVVSVSQAGRALGGLSAQPMRGVSGSKGVFEATIGGEVSSAGVYDVELSVAGVEGTVLRALRATTGAGIRSATWVVRAHDSKKKGKKAAQSSETTETKLAYGETLPAGFSAHEGQIVSLKFAVTADDGGSMMPHQVFLELTHAETGVRTVFTGLLADTTTGEHKVTLDVGSASALKTASAGGQFSARLLVGDVALDEPIAWSMGSITLSPPAPRRAKEEILYAKPLLHESETTLSPLREITHVFRAPEARVPAVIALAIAGAVASPIVLYFLWATAAGGCNMRGFPTGTSFLYAVGFHAGLGGIMLLFAAYWLASDMMTTLAYLSVIGAATALFGYFLLRAQLDAEAKSK
jgi:hypothetical protein